ncbi:SufD family Fe-S cluster assembly protein [Anaerocolumna sp. MB42-C2]|uniref:SufD family Fe-S cluster assembly protein n=1 Tax=Anaerocolumna sp. MB42-C2 TaxID=3070997 RepID=UPI0027E17790|nr:SufD family Fe-S cluster assembly protein [Anaerocolumna sp. MB42-C2]WMJ88778.1 SufD family Fe-S cluster assembly protein [Anaerocolumna sp. MB42-C2]
MNLQLNNMNKLPVRTWSWLGINEVSLKENIPEITAYNKEPFKSGKTLPDSLILTDNLNSETLIASINTGMGEDAIKFVKEYKNSGISLRIPEGTKVKEPIYLDYRLEKDNSTVVDLNHIIAEENSEITVVLSYRSEEDETMFHSGVTYLYAGKNAVINLIQVQLLGDKANHLNNVCAKLDGGTIHYNQSELGSFKSISSVYADLSGDNSNMDISTIFFGDFNRSLDFNYVVNHIGKMTQSKITMNGALLDHSSKVFKGTLDFKKGASGSIGQERENTLLFSPKIRNISAPLILCAEENVEGKHAANSGKIDENKLFYMMSRGLDEISAKKLMIEAWFDPVISEIPFSFLRSDITEYVKRRLSHV